VANFDDLAIPYRAVATDLLTGDMVVIKEGDLLYSDVLSVGDGFWREKKSRSSND
jgi:predicted acylesterase/phospholipase RssA